MKNIVIDTSSFFVTLKCNLRCKHCCTGTPYAKGAAHFPLKHLKDSVSRYFEIIKFIRKFSLTGGEPFLRLDLHELIEEVLQYSNQFDVFEIVTNGTIMPNDGTIDAISKKADKTYVMIDRYGKLSEKADELYELLKSSGVRCHIREYGDTDAYSGGWVDLGAYSEKHNSKNAEKLFKMCNIVNKKKTNTATDGTYDYENDFLIVYCTMYNGQLHYCGRSAATLRHLNIDKDSDYVEVTNQSIGIEELRNKIIKMYTSQTPFACAYCNGELDDSPRVVPAQQMP